MARCAFSAGSATATRAKFADLLRRLPRSGRSGGAEYANVVGLVANEIDVSAQWGALAQRLQDLWTTGSTGGPIPDQFPASPARWRSTAPTAPTQGRPPSSGRRRSPTGVGAPSAPCGPGRPSHARPGRATAADRYTGPWTRRTANPVLVVNNTRDPASPYHAAVALTRELGRARLLTVDGPFTGAG